MKGCVAVLVFLSVLVASSPAFAAGCISHKLILATAEGSDPTVIRTSSWNACHNVTGGANFQIMARNTAAADGWSLTNLYYDHANDRLGLNRAAPGFEVHLMQVAGSTVTQVMEAYAASTNLVGRVAGGTLGSPAATVNTTTLLRLGGRGHDGTNFVTTDLARIEFVAAEAWSGTNQGTRVMFSTTPTGSTTLTERMRITAAGNLAVGGTQEDSRLHVQNGSAGTVTAAGGTALTVEGGGSTFLSILTPATSTGVLTFGSPTSNRRGEVAYNHSTDLLILKAQGAADRLIVGNNVTIGATVAGTPLANSLFFTGVAFASLATPSNGSIIYCSNCTIANPCAGSGTGAIAKRLNSVWVCN